MSSRSFGKTHRLLNAADYKAVFDDAPWRANHPQLLVLSRPNTLSHPRLGLIAAKKHLKLACQRNRLKRLIRESFRHSQHQLPAADIIVLSRPGISDLKNTEIVHLLEKSWRRLRKVSDPNYTPPANNKRNRNNHRKKKPKTNS